MRDLDRRVRTLEATIQRKPTSILTATQWATISDADLATLSDMPRVPEVWSEELIAQAESIIARARVEQPSTMTAPKRVTD